MTLNLHLPTKGDSLRPNITVIGVGGAGGNAVNNMIKANLEGVQFVVANTDAQALEHSLTETRIQLGAHVTQGLGAGAAPEVGAASAEEAIEEIAKAMDGSNMVFITAGMGGGTGTGAAPVVAKLARDMGILTVGVVTKPFHFEGTHRMRIADNGLDELQHYVDTLIVIPNQNLFRIANEKTTFADAFALADDVLHSGVRGVTDLMVMPGLINLDFADIRTVMREMGKAMMGTGEAEGDRRAVEAAESAISNPLLDDVSMKGARGVLINITGGSDLTLFEVDEAANRIREEVDPEANIIFGAIFDETLEGKIRVSVVATGVDAEAMNRPQDEDQRFASAHQPLNIRSAAPTMPKPQVAEPFRKVSNPIRPAEVSEYSAIKPTASNDSESQAKDDKKTEAEAESQSAKPAPVLAPSVPKFSFGPAKEASGASASVAPSEPAAAQPASATPANTARASGSAVPASYVPSQPPGGATIRPAESAIYQQPAAEAVAVHEGEERSRSMAASMASNMGGGLLKRVGKALAKPEVEETYEPQPQLRGLDGGKPTDAAKEESKEEYLDIPAFLRRQAN